MPKLKPGTVIPQPGEDAAIAAGIAADAGSQELGADWCAMARPASEVLPQEAYAELVKRPHGRPKAEETKVFTAIRLDPDVLEAFRATGKGWQTRMNAALRQYLREHPLQG